MNETNYSIIRPFGGQYFIVKGKGHTVEQVGTTFDTFAAAQEQLATLLGGMPFDDDTPCSCADADGLCPDHRRRK